MRIVASSQSTKIKEQRSFFQKIRPISFRLCERGFAAPARDFCVIAGQQNFRHAHSLKLRRPRVMRIIQQTIREGLSRRRRFAAKRSRQQANGRIDDYQRGRLASRQNIVANRNFVGHQRFRDALVNAFVTAANQNELFAQWQIRPPAIALKRATLRRKQDDALFRSGSVSRRWRRPAIQLLQRSVRA